MYSLGVIRVGDKFRWVLLKMDKAVVVERMEEGDEIPADVLTIKNLKIATGLPGSSVLRRDLKLPLTSEKTIRKALAFQLEPLLPFPLDDSIVYTEFHPSEKETLIVVWATTCASIQSHLNEWEFLDPDLVSTESLALSRWAEHQFPEREQLVVMHDRLGIALDKGVTTCAMESSDPERLKLFLQQKFPHFNWIDQDLQYAIPWGLALEPLQKNPCQFRLKASQRKKLTDRQLVKKTLIYGLGLITALALISETLLRVQESKIKNQIAAYVPHQQGSASQQVDSFRNFIIKETKASSLPVHLPPVQDVLAWISSFKAPIEIQHLAYEEDQGLVTVEFEAQDAAGADLFVKELKKSPSFVEPNQEVKWTTISQGYKLSFKLRPSGYALQR